MLAPALIDASTLSVPMRPISALPESRTRMALASPVTYVLDLEIAQPAFLLRHEIRQREGRDRSGEHHLDLAGMRGGRVDGEQRRGDANVHAKACDAKVWAECTRSNVRHDNSPPDRQAIVGGEK